MYVPIAAPFRVANSRIFWMSRRTKLMVATRSEKVLHAYLGMSAAHHLRAGVLLHLLGDLDRGGVELLPPVREGLGQDAHRLERVGEALTRADDRAGRLRRAAAETEPVGPVQSLGLEPGDDAGVD